jgi:hypothetical protein
MRFDQRTRGEILGAIRIGVSYERAATSAGVAVRTLRRWLRQGEAEEKAGENTGHARFVREFRKAESEALGQVESNIWQASQEDWRAGAWLLSKKLPQQYGKDDEVERTEMQQRMAAEFIDFIEGHVGADAFKEVLEALAGWGDTELDSQALPVPA